MTNSTTQFWDVDGTSLQTYATNIRTWGGSREGVPDLRGEDTLIPYRPGRRWVEKVPDSRTITIAGWVVGANPDGSIGDVETFRKNWRLLRALLWTPGRQIALTKRWIDPRTGEARTATGLAQYQGGLTPEMTGPNRAEFTVDLHMADPFFWGEEVVTSFDLGAGATREIDVLGDYRTTRIVVEMEGPITSGRLTVTDVVPQVWLRYLDLQDGRTVAIDVDRFRAIESDGSLDTFTTGNVRHDGSPYWLVLEPGTRSVTLTSTAGTGTATLAYRPAWL